MLGFFRQTLLNLFSRPATRNYPEVPRKPVAGSRGHLLMDPVVCVYCGLCATRCPSKAITVDRPGKTWTLEPGRCIICGYCVEVCPKKCMWLDPRHGLPEGCVDARSGNSQGNL